LRIIMALGLLALSACGSSEEKTKIGDVEFVSNEKAGTAEINTKDGSLGVIDGPAAEEIKPPAFAPKYPGSVFVSALINSAPDKPKKTTINFTTDDSLEKIAAFYREQFKAQGFTIGMNMVTEESIMINAESGEKKVNVIASIVDGKPGGVLSFSGE
jgi:hypothetical protein